MTLQNMIGPFAACFTDKIKSNWSQVPPPASVAWHPDPWWESSCHQVRAFLQPGSLWRMGRLDWMDVAEHDLMQTSGILVIGFCRFETWSNLKKMCLANNSSLSFSSLDHYQNVTHVDDNIVVLQVQYIFFANKLSTLVKSTVRVIPQSSSFAWMTARSSSIRPCPFLRRAMRKFSL